MPLTCMLVACGDGDSYHEPGGEGGGDAGSDAPVADAPIDSFGEETSTDASEDEGSPPTCTNHFDGLSPLSTCGWTGENGSPYGIWGPSDDDIYVVGHSATITLSSPSQACVQPLATHRKVRNGTSTTSPDP